MEHASKPDTPAPKDKDTPAPSDEQRQIMGGLDDGRLINGA